MSHIQRRLLLVGCILFIWALYASSSILAQEVHNERPMQGLTWDPPEDVEEALDELQRFSDASVEALQAPLIQEDTLFALADSLEITFYQNLSPYRWTSRQLRDSLAVLEAELEQALATGDGYESARHLGLATLSNLSDERACEPMANLSAQAREASDTVQLYYITQFVEHNPCAESFDLILLDVRDKEDPVAHIQRWLDQSEEEVAYGIGALGTWADTTAQRGLHVPHSLDYQARYLENHLGQFLGDQPALNEQSPEVLFVYRWDEPSTPIDGFVPGTLTPRSYALTAHEREYPAWDVVRGWYTGEQTVFAFQAGEEPGGGINWLVLMAWLVVIVLGGYYLSDSRFRHMLKRYIGSRSFYRDAVREGRNILMAPSLLILVANGISLGIIATALGQVAQQTVLFPTLLARLPAASAEQLVELLTQPAMFILLIAGVYALLMCLWAAAMSLLSRKGFPLGFDQVLMLVAWPRWLVIPLMLVAVSVSTLTPEQALIYLSVIVVIWLVVMIYALFRTVTDYIQLAQLGASSYAGTMLVSPAFLFLTIATFLLLEYRADAVFIWHLVTRA